jgi:hypothetical protein
MLATAGKSFFFFFHVQNTKESLLTTH